MGLGIIQYHWKNLFTSEPGPVANDPEALLTNDGPSNFPASILLGRFVYRKITCFGQTDPVWTDLSLHKANLKIVSFRLPSYLNMERRSDVVWTRRYNLALAKSRRQPQESSVAFDKRDGTSRSDPGHGRTVTTRTTKSGSARKICRIMLNATDSCVIFSWSFRVDEPIHRRLQSRSNLLTSLLWIVRKVDHGNRICAGVHPGKSALGCTQPS